MFHLIKIAAFWMVCAGAAVAQGSAAENGIIVTGEGRVSLPPDMVTVRLGVAGTGETASAAMGEVTDTAAAILAQLDASGIAAKDRQTSGFYLRPVHNNRAGSQSEPPKFTGYQAGNQITVRIRDLETSGAVLDAVLEIGVNNFNGLSFGLQDDAAALAEARARAVADAQLRAAQLADAAGIALGPVLQMRENSHHGGPVMMEMAQSRSSMGDAIAGGEVDVVAQVTIVFGIAGQ